MITELLVQLFKNEFNDYICSNERSNKSFQQYCEFIEEVFGEFYGIMTEKDFETKLRAFIQVQRDRQKVKKVLTVEEFQKKQRSEEFKNNIIKIKKL